MRGKPGHGKRPQKDRLPRDSEKAQEKLDEEMAKFNAKRGGNVEIYKQAMQKKLDNQLKEFMEQKKKSAEQPEEKPAEAAATEGANEEEKPAKDAKQDDASKRQVVQQK